jgi:hypothetical protein
LEVGIGCRGVNLGAIVQEVRSRKQGQHLNTPKKKLPSLAYFITIIQLIDKNSYKELKMRVGFVV